MHSAASDPGQPLPILEGHVSAGRLERVLRSGKFAVTAETGFIGDSDSNYDERENATLANTEGMPLGKDAAP